MQSESSRASRLGLTAAGCERPLGLRCDWCIVKVVSNIPEPPEPSLMLRQGIAVGGLLAADGRVQQALYKPPPQDGLQVLRFGTSVLWPTRETTCLNDSVKLGALFTFRLYARARFAQMMMPCVGRTMRRRERSTVPAAWSCLRTSGVIGQIVFTK